MISWLLTLFAAVSFLEIGLVVDCYLIRKNTEFNLTKFWGLGLGAIAIFQMIAGVISLPVTPQVVYWLTALEFLPWIIDRPFRKRIWNQILTKAKKRPAAWETILSGGFIVLLFLLTFSQGIWGHDAYGFWLSKSRAFWIDNGINLRNLWFFWPADHPLLWPLVANWFYKLTGLVNGYFVRVIPFFTFIFLGLKIRNFLWRAVLILTPFMFLTLVAPEYGGNADLLAGFFILLAATNLLQGSLAYTGIFLGLAALTKNEGLPILLAFPVFAAIFLRQEKEFKIGVLTAFVFLGFDWIFKLFFGLTSRYLERNIGEIVVARPIGKYLTYTTLAIREEFRQIYKWSLGWWLIIFVLAINWKKTLKSRRALVLCLLMGVYFLSLFWVYYVTPEDQASHIASSLSRVLVQLYPALIYLCSYLSTTTPLKSLSWRRT